MGDGSEESSGILLEVSEPRPSSDREAARSFIDYEEIAGLLDGIDHIRKANHSVTKLANFEAIYRTKGGVWITVYNATEGNRVAVQSGRIGGQTATLELEHLDQLRALIVRAKEILDNPQNTPTEAAPPTTQTIAPPAAAAAPPVSAPTIPTPAKRPKVVKKGGQSSGPQNRPKTSGGENSVSLTPTSIQQWRPCLRDSSGDRQHRDRRRSCGSDEVGTVINPLIVEGQIHGGLAQGLGQALLEHCAYDDGGQLVAGSFMATRSRARRSAALRDRMRREPALHAQSAGRQGLQRGRRRSFACGAGERGAPRARAAGVTDLQMPLTAEQVWRRIREAGRM